MCEAAVGFITMWVSILIHEAAHVAAAMVVLDTARLSAASLSAAPARTRALWVAAGPAVTLAILAAAVLTILMTRRGFIAFVGLALSAMSRTLFVALPTLRNADHGVNDELTVGHAFGVSPRLLWSVEAACIVVSLLTIIAVSRRRKQPVDWIGMAVGIAIGWGTALTFGRWIGLPI